MRQGFYSPYFIVPKKGGPILDLRVLNRALHKLPFKMLTHRRTIKCIQPQDWFAAIDLKDAYFHVSILPRHRPFLRFAFEGRAWQYRVLPFGLSLSPRVFTKVVEGAITPLREVGVRILNYLDDWLILAQSREQLDDHRDLVLQHLSQLGLRVNWKKSKISPVQRISFLGMELDSVSMTARLTEERAQAVLNCLSSFRGRNVVPLKQFQRLLGHMASADAVTPLGLLHMRPLQHWLHSRVLRWAWRRGTLRVGITQQCRRSLSPWTDLAFLRAGVPLEQVSRHTVVTTDASSTGWKLWAALCLPRRAAEREGCLQTEVGPLDSGGRRLGVPVARRAVPPGGEGSLHQECCLLPCVVTRCLFDRSEMIRASPMSSWHSVSVPPCQGTGVTYVT